MNQYYRCDGTPYASVQEWATDFETRSDGSGIVKQETLPDGRWVSTVWLGIDHNFGSGPPLIFETMVFSDEHDLLELYCQRYSTEVEAIAGHAEIVRRARAGEFMPEATA